MEFLPNATAQQSLISFVGDILATGLSFCLVSHIFTTPNYEFQNQVKLLLFIPSREAVAISGGPMLTPTPPQPSIQLIICS